MHHYIAVDDPQKYLIEEKKEDFDTRYRFSEIFCLCGRDSRWVGYEPHDIIDKTGKLVRGKEYISPVRNWADQDIQILILTT